MAKLIASINMTLDGFCDHDAIIPDDEVHDHYSDVLRSAGALLYGRVTYQMMESYWPEVVKEPTGNKSTDDFAALMDNAQKIVFSRTLKDVSWKNSTLKNEISREEILQLKQQPGKPMFAGSPGLIVSLAKMNLIDEYQLCVHPVVVGSGLVLFKNITDRIELKLINTKTFGGGAIVLYYENQKNNS